MAEKHILYDRTELVVRIATSNRYVNVNIRCDEISRIQFSKCKEFRFFRMVPSEKITIITSKYPTPIEFLRCREKKYFDEYKEILEKFAKDNHITFYNNL